MIQMRYIRRVALLVLLVFSSLIITIAVLSVYIPRILESRILPRIARAAGIEDLSVEVRHIGFHGADIGPLNIGSTPRTTRILDSIQLHYSPGAWYTKHIESIVLKGIILSCEHRDGEFFIQGFDLRKILGSLQKKNAGTKSTERAPTLSIGRIGIEQAAISLKWKGRRIRLPISVEIEPISPTWQTVDLKLKLYPRDQVLYLSAAIDLNKKTAQLAFNAKDFHPEVFSDFTGIIPGLSTSGSVDAEGSIRMGFDPIQVLDSLASIWIRNGNINYNTVRLQTGLGKQDQPSHITISGKGRDWKLSAADIAGISPVPFHIPQITGNIAFTDAGLEQVGDVTLIIFPPKRKLPVPLKMRDPITLPIRYSANYAGNKKWSFKLAASRVDVTARSTRIHLPRILMDGWYRGQSGVNAAMEGKLSFSEAKIVDPAFHAKIDGIEGAIPLVWPLNSPGEKGWITVGRIRWQDLDIGSSRIAIQQSKDGFSIDGKHTSALFPGLSVGIKGRSTILGTDQPMAEIYFDVIQYYLPSDSALGKILPAAGSIAVTGTLNADLKIQLRGPEASGMLNGELIDGSMALEGKDAIIEGIYLGLSLPDLPDLRSAPKQHLRFERASFGALNATDGQIDFRIESADSLLIEKSSLKWGEGSLYTHAMRFRPGSNDYNLTVYCDRLSLAQLLEQIGSVKAEGSGTVNGRIPIEYRNNKLRFKDGFLYSTPGDGGSIRLTDTEILTAGIPPDTPQYAQLELARQALEDYDYKWVKLNLESREDILLMGMQLDGKPANPLPFVYRKELGRFARIEAGGEGSNFQGISLDVNFKVPLDKILHHGGALKKAFGGS